MSSINTFSRQVFFETVHGKQIFTTTDLVENSKKVVILSHGFRGTSCGSSRQFVEFASLLNKHGISAVRFDQPGCGNSEGEFLNSSFNKWVQTIQYFAQKYLDLGFEVFLFGQSMGATASMIASAHPELSQKISGLFLWVPDPKTSVSVDPNQIYEEGGQQYYGKFWQEAASADFFSCFEKFEGVIHLVYGEHDKYIKQELRDRAIEVAKRKGGKVEILAGEDHSAWKFESARRIMEMHVEEVGSS